MTFRANYEETRRALALGLFGVAMVSFGALVEQLLEEGIILNGEKKNNKELPQKIHNMELWDVIERANKEGIIEKDDYKNLDSFRKNIRNPYGHGNYLDIISDANLPEIEFKDENGNRLNEEDLKKYNKTFIGALKKQKKDSFYAIPLLCWINGLSERISKKLKIQLNRNYKITDMEVLEG